MQVLIMHGLGLYSQGKSGGKVYILLWSGNVRKSQGSLQRSGENNTFVM